MELPQQVTHEYQVQLCKDMTPLQMDQQLWPYRTDSVSESFIELRVYVRALVIPVAALQKHELQFLTSAWQLLGGEQAEWAPSRRRRSFEVTTCVRVLHLQVHVMHLIESEGISATTTSSARSGR